MGQVARSEARTAGRLNLLAGAGAVILAGASALIGAEEMQLATLERRLDDQVGLLGRGQSASLQWDVVGAAPRAQLATAIFLARRAHSLPPEARRADIDRGRTAVRAAIGARPHWAEAWVALAYLESLGGAERSPWAVSALAASYRDAPFIKGSASWRAGFGLRHWLSLTPQTQVRVVDEAVWIAMQDGRARVALLALARKGPAYQPFLRRWHEARSRERLLLLER